MKVSSTAPSLGIGNENVYQNYNYNKKSVEKNPYNTILCNVATSSD